MDLCVCLLPHWHLHQILDLIVTFDKWITIELLQTLHPLRMAAINIAGRRV